MQYFKVFLHDIGDYGPPHFLQLYILSPLLVLLLWFYNFVCFCPRLFLRRHSSATFHSSSISLSFSFCFDFSWTDPIPHSHFLVLVSFTIHWSSLEDLNPNNVYFIYSISAIGKDEFVIFWCFVDAWMDNQVIVTDLDELSLLNVFVCQSAYIVQNRIK